MRSKIINFISILVAISALASCSVYKASSNEGVSVKDVVKCSAKGCFLSLGMDIVDSKESEDGDYVETYRGKARKSGGNYLRAVGHGALDVATLGLWEVVGTPVEGAISNNLGFITVIATYPNRDTEVAIKLDIFDAHGKKIQARKDTKWDLK